TYAEHPRGRVSLLPPLLKPRLWQPGRPMKGEDMFFRRRRKQVWVIRLYRPLLNRVEKSILIGLGIFALILALVTLAAYLIGVAGILAAYALGSPLWIPLILVGELAERTAHWVPAAIYIPLYVAVYGIRIWRDLTGRSRQMERRKFLM